MKTSRCTWAACLTAPGLELYEVRIPSTATAAAAAAAFGSSVLLWGVEALRCSWAAWLHAMHVPGIIHAGILLIFPMRSVCCRAGRRCVWYPCTGSIIPCKHHEYQQQCAVRLSGHPLVDAIDLGRASLPPFLGMEPTLRQHCCCYMAGSSSSHGYSYR